MKSLRRLVRQRINVKLCSLVNVGKVKTKWFREASITNLQCYVDTKILLFFKCKIIFITNFSFKLNSIQKK